MRIMPHSAFDGRTPNEVCSRDRPELEQELIEARHRARAERLRAHRSLVCEACVGRDPTRRLVTQKAVWFPLAQLPRWSVEGRFTEQR